MITFFKEFGSCGAVKLKAPKSGSNTSPEAPPTNSDPGRLKDAAALSLHILKHESSA